jgi:hypothetical protein
MLGCSEERPDAADPTTTATSEGRAPDAGLRPEEGHSEHKTAEMRGLMAALLNDVDYQYRLREDFRKRRVLPSTEAIVWAHVVGKPTEKIEMSANVTMEKKFADEREVCSRLSVEHLEELAVQSQALVDKATAMGNGNYVESRRRSSSLAPANPSGRRGAAHRDAGLKDRQLKGAWRPRLPEGRCEKRPDPT